MANKYCIHGAAFNGDGTTSSVAASDGAAGAWNSFTQAASGTPTYGTLADGDVVYFKTNHSASDITVTISASLTFKDTTDSELVNTFVFDDGTVWAGEGGTLTCNTTGDYIYTFPDNVRVKGIGQNFVIKSNSFGDWITVNVYGIVEGLHLTSPVSGSNRNKFILHNGTLIDSKFSINGTTTEINTPIVGTGTNLGATIEGFEFEFLDNADSYTGYCLLFNNSGDGEVICNNLTITGAPTVADRLYISRYATAINRIEVNNVQIDNASYVPQFYENGTFNYSSFSVGPIKQVTTLYNFLYSDKGAVTDWTQGQNYPTLNGLLPDGATYFSVRCSHFADNNTGKLLNLTKYYDQATGVKTITGNLLLHENFDPAHNVNAKYYPQKNNWFMSVSYIDSTGVRRTETTYDVGNLATSTATWSSTTYGAKTYDKYEMALTTSQQVLTESLITVQFFVNTTKWVGTDFFFLDPDVVIS